MNDLRQAIYDVLQDCDTAYDSYGDSDPENVRIAREKLQVLQAEYNIHFVEPHEPQVNEV